MPSAFPAWTPCGSWACGSGALPAEPLPSPTPATWRPSRRPFPISMSSATSSARPTACAGSSSTSATVLDIADQCDGVRCDMAMLLLNRVFAQTWGERVGWPPPSEYWTDVIGAVRAAHPGFVFMAEAYWDLEHELQSLGFDFCYDKRLYDRLESGDAPSICQHLQADLDYQNRLVRFLENHDEPRAAATFTPDRERAAAVVIATLPGALLWHEG